MRIPIYITITLSALALAGCGKKPATHDVDSDSIALLESSFHADEDIAMLVRSIADAIKVGEALDSMQYNGIAILTDGSGRPLYNSVTHGPGRWRIIATERSARIYSMSDGDLTPADLEEYVLECLPPGDEGNLETIETDCEEVSQKKYHFASYAIQFRDSLTKAGSMMSVTITGTAEGS